jgi:hypothetical protein
MFDRPKDGAKPYFVALAVMDGEPPVLQPVTRNQFFALLNHILKPRVQSCGVTHVETVEVPDDQVEEAKRALTDAARDHLIIPATH